MGRPPKPPGAPTKLPFVPREGVGQPPPARPMTDDERALIRHIARQVVDRWLAEQDAKQPEPALLNDAEAGR